MQLNPHIQFPYIPIRSGQESVFSAFKFHIPQQQSDKEIQNEIETRMKLFGLPQEMIEQTKKGTIYLNNRGKISELNDREELQFISEIERRFKVKIYYVYKSNFIGFADSGYRYFYINNDKDHWEFDRVDIMIHEPICFKYGLVQGERKPYAQAFSETDITINECYKGDKKV